MLGLLNAIWKICHFETTIIKETGIDRQSTTACYMERRMILLINLYLISVCSGNPMI